MEGFTRGRIASREITHVTNAAGEKFKTLCDLLRLTIDAPKRGGIRFFLSNLIRPVHLPNFYNDDECVRLDPTRPRQNTIPIDELTCPLRMFDIDTMNIVEIRHLNSDDHYCVLSHSWKGTEIDYRYFCRATKRDDQHSELRQSYTSDIDMLEEQCGHDLAWIVKEVQRSSQTSVEEGFQKYLRIQELSENLRSAEQAEAEARKDRDTAMQQKRRANDILRHPAISHWVDAPNQRLERATENRKMAHEEKEEFLLRTSVPNDNAMENLLKCLQRIRSLRKIKESLSKARDIFDTRHFSKNSKRYLWLDTCCIDKSDAGELTKSLALMGEWYANADFCLVHLDTDIFHDDWMEEWSTYGIDFLQDDWMKYWKACVNDSPTWTNKPNASDFGNIEAASSMRWATRGWTLQELVLSKMTFFFNSQWSELGRTVDGLGPYYYLTPFLDQYLKHTEFSWGFGLENMWEDLFMKFETLSYGDSLEIQIKQLVFLLQGVGFVVPRHLSVQTSESQIDHAIRACSVQDLRKDLKERFELEIPPDTSCSDRETVIFILRKLRDVAQEPIRIDRQEISRFTKITTLPNWAQGTSPTDNSAYNVLITSSARKTEVLTDKAYSLMGILNVRFPAFPAEGLPKALCRLLDEKIIVSNDISIFNWSGKYFGSTIQGRSLYPSCIEAYQNHAEVMSLPAVRDINKLVLDASEDDRSKKKKITHLTINLLLGDMIKLVGPLDHDVLDDELIESFIHLIGFIKQLPFDSLELERVSDELRKIRERFMNISDRYEQENENTHFKQQPNDLEDDAPDPSEYKESEVGSGQEQEESQRSTQPGNQPAREEIVSDGTYYCLEKEVQTPLEEERSHKKSRFGIIGRIPKLTIEISAPLKIKTPKLDLPRSLYYKLKSEKAPDKPREPSEFEKIMANFRNELKESVMNLGNMKKLPSEDEDKNDTFSAASVSGLKPLPVGYGALQSKCHNPIVISSSGISGTFDIQRIAVGMLERDYLRALIRKSVSGQNIESWCTVSTGFAYILVNFNCERDIVEQQLDMTEVVEETFLKASETGPMSDDASDSLRKTLKKTGDDDFSTVETEKDLPKKRTDAQKRLGNCIDMIQEQDLHAVAGEWVLARFSDVPAAEWFLCRLELGSGNEFYGRRIPTDAFTFENAIPEEGLIDYWEQLMTKRKDIVCDAMLKYMKGKRIRRNEDHFFKNKKQQDAERSGKKDSEAGSSKGSFTFMIEELAQGATRLGDYGLRRLADRMLEDVDRISLENIPPQLRAAVMSLGSKEELKPAMVRSGINIHMF